MRKIWLWAIGLALLCAGCSQVEDHLTINADGSGEVVIRTLETELPQELVMSREMLRQGMLSAATGEVSYPPLTEEVAKALFPAGAFQEVTFRQVSEQGKKWLVTTAKFKDVSPVLVSPYARLHRLQVQRGEGALQVQARVYSSLMGMVQDLYLERAAKADAPGTFGVRRELMAGLLQGLDWRFSLTLPAAVSAELATAEGNTAVAQYRYERDKEAFFAGVTRLFTVRCADAGVTFTPQLPLIPGVRELSAFQEGVMTGEGKSESKGAEAVRAAAELTPGAVRIERAFDIGGERQGTNRTEILLAVSFPKALGVFSVDEATVQSAVTDTGASMLMKERNHYSNNYNANFGREKPADTGRDSFILGLNLAAPPEGSKAIASVKGTYRVALPSVQCVIVKDAILPVKEGEAGEQTAGMQADNRQIEKAGQRLQISRETNGVFSGGKNNRARVYALYVHSMGGEKKTQLGTVGLYDPEGKPVDLMVMRSGGSNQAIWLPPETADKPLTLVALLTTPGTEGATTVSFELKDIPLQPVEAGVDVKAEQKPAREKTATGK